MKVLLINPPQTYPNSFFKRNDVKMSIPLGAAMIAAVLEDAGHKVSILDALTTDGLRIIEEEKMIQAKAAAHALAAKRGYLSPISLTPLAKKMFAELPEGELKRIASMRSRRHGPARKLHSQPKRRTLHKVLRLFEDDLFIDIIADMITDDPDVFEELID